MNELYSKWSYYVKFWTEFCTNEEFLKYLYRNWNSVAPHVMQYNDSAPSDVVKELSEVIYEEWLKNESLMAPGCKALVKVRNKIIPKFWIFSKFLWILNYLLGDRRQVIYSLHRICHQRISSQKQHSSLLLQI